MINTVVTCDGHSTNSPCTGEDVEKPDGGTLDFEFFNETWGDILSQIEKEGWSFVGGPHQSKVLVYCPTHTKIRKARP